MLLTVATKEKIAINILFLFFVAFPFVEGTSSLSYVSFEILTVLYISNFFAQKQYQDVFFKYYMFLVIWATLVSIFSVDRHLSFIILRYWLIPLFVYISLVNLDIKTIFCRYVWIPTALLFVINLLLFMWWFSEESKSLFVSYPVLSSLLLFSGDWFVKIYTSTVVLCLLIAIFFILEPSKNRTILLIVNLMSAFLSYDRAFWFSLLVIIVLYMMLEKVKISLKTFISTCVMGLLALVILVVIMYLLKMDLHVKERLATYSYWISMLKISPIYGVGIGRDSLHYYVVHYPVPENILQANPFTPYTSHNFFLDLVLTQGVIGLIVFMVFLYKVVRASINQCVNAKFKYMSLYMVIAIFSKFLVDNQFDNRKIFVFCFFILCGYLLSVKNKNSY